MHTCVELVKCERMVRATTQPLHVILRTAGHTVTVTDAGASWWLERIFCITKYVPASVNTAIAGLAPVQRLGIRPRTHQKAAQGTLIYVSILRYV
jgi:hypothetical protein